MQQLLLKPVLPRGADVSGTELARCHKTRVVSWRCSTEECCHTGRHSSQV